MAKSRDKGNKEIRKPKKDKVAPAAAAPTRRAASLCDPCADCA